MASAIDEDTRRTLASGRQTLGAMLAAAQRDLQKVFIVFVIGFLGTFYLLRLLVWDQLKADLFARLGPNVPTENLVVATTPFDVILLQVKIGLVVGVVLCLPVLLYYSRDALRERGWWPTLPRWKIATLGATALVLFLSGVIYSYELFFPLMFDFLTSNAIQTGVRPTYSIVMWAQFVFLLTLSFGLAAELPLAMSGLSYAEIVPYEVFREKWKYAVIAIFGFGALFSPPDPFTQILWALPLLVLYVFSLYLTKFIVAVKYGSQHLRFRRALRERWYVVLGSGLLGAAIVGAVLIAASLGVFAGSITVPGFGTTVALPSVGLVGAIAGLGVSRLVASILVCGLGALVLAVFAGGYVIYSSIDLAAATRSRPGGSLGDPAAIEVSELDLAGVRAAPAEAFAAMSEEAALSDASAAMDAGDHERAQAILDRFDEAQADAEAAVRDRPADSPESEWPDEWESATPTTGPTGETGSGAPESTTRENSEAAGDSNAFASTAAGMVDAFTEEETTEDDIGGYYYDIAFIASSLRSKTFRLVALFMVVLGGTFYFLYQGGVGQIKADFLSRLPAGLAPTNVDVVALHPVEVLIFDVKISTLAAAIATAPFLFYYAWPSLKERGLASGDRRVLLVWAGTLAVGLIGGSAVGYGLVAPSVISWLAADATRASMVIAYRISSAGWLVFFTTVGVGLLAVVPLSMVLFSYGRILSYQTMRSRWREVTLAVLAIVAYTTPQGVFMMFIIGIPVMLAYGLGLLLTWLTTLGGRRRTGGRGRTAD